MHVHMFNYNVGFYSTCISTGFYPQMFKFELHYMSLEMKGLTEIKKKKKKIIYF